MVGEVVYLLVTAPTTDRPVAPVDKDGSPSTHQLVTASTTTRSVAPVDKDGSPFINYWDDEEPISSETTETIFDGDMSIIEIKKRDFELDMAGEGRGAAELSQEQLFTFAAPEHNDDQVVAMSQMNGHDEQYGTKMVDVLPDQDEALSGLDPPHSRHR